MYVASDVEHVVPLPNMLVPLSKAMTSVSPVPLGVKEVERVPGEGMVKSTEADVPPGFTPVTVNRPFEPEISIVSAAGLKEGAAIVTDPVNTLSFALFGG